ncbi:hypothetical protein C8R46DRAFT_1294370 [Mycena filopes]|nr:hypothetical protein C8R46DRAFT_1294370 [Mycena filopes]
MILDMKVRWSSTYSMLDRGYQLKEFVDTFIFEIARDEKDREKREKLTALQLTEAKWSRIDLFLNVLQSAQNAQHAFSADLRSTLHLAIPALEKLHAEWTVKSNQAKYSVFHDALEQALLKVDEHYQKTSNSNSYMFAMGTFIHSGTVFISNRSEFANQMLVIWQSRSRDETHNFGLKSSHTLRADSGSGFSRQATPRWEPNKLK